MIEAMSRAPLIIVPLACKDIYLDRYARPDKGWADRDESHWPVPYWYIDTGFATLLILLAAVDEGLGAVFFGIMPENMPDFRSRFGVSDNWTPIGAIAVGHPARRLTRCRRPRGSLPGRAWMSWCTAAGGDRTDLNRVIRSPRRAGSYG
jgi:hypothetical protein